MAHTASLSQLQHPAVASVNGEIVPYDGVKIHVSAEALTRALSVFEGLKGYWNADATEFGVRAPRRHYERLRRSGQLLHIPVDFTYDEFESAIIGLAQALLTPERDMWFRATLYVVEGHWGAGTRADLVVTAYHQSKEPAPPMALTVSSWRRSGDTQLPYRAKASANYIVARQARIEAGLKGFDDAVLLNDAGRVAEATGSCVVALRDGQYLSPPAYEGALESITLETVAAILQARGDVLERQPVDRSELHTSQALAVAGTISELTPISALDATTYDLDTDLARLRDEYLRVMRRDQHVEGVAFTTLPVAELRAAEPA